MAITLQLTDGTQTVDFNDGTSLRLGNAFQQNTGGGSVTELVIAGWVDSVTTDQKAAKMRDIHQLIRKGVRHFRNRHIDRAVWLKVQAEGATSAQYAKVMGGGVVEVPANTIGGRLGGVVQVEIVREGFWRSMAPDGTAGTEIVSSTTTYNKSDADGDNWVSEPARDIDAPGLLRFEITPANATESLLIARKIGTTAELDNFNPWFNPDDASYTTGGSDSAETDAPGDVQSRIVGTSTTVTATWTIAAANLADYVGRYACYAVIYQDFGDASATVTFNVDLTGGYSSAALDVPLDVSGSAGNVPLYFGSLSFPGVGVNPFATQNAGVDINLTFTIGAGTGYGASIWGIWFIPLDFPPFEVKLAGSTTTNTFIIDGVTQTTYTLNATPEQTFVDLIETQGIYPVLEPNTTNRFYIWGRRGSADHYFNDSYTVIVDCVDRFETLRGGA